MSEQFVLSLDLGTTTLRAFIYDQNGTIRGCDTDKVNNILILKTSTSNPPVLFYSNRCIYYNLNQVGQKWIQTSYGIPFCNWSKELWKVSAK